MENHHFKWVNQLFLWSFFIAMLVYQRVIVPACSTQFIYSNPDFALGPGLGYFFLGLFSQYCLKSQEFQVDSYNYIYMHIEIYTVVVFHNIYIISIFGSTKYQPDFSIYIIYPHVLIRIFPSKTFMKGNRCNAPIQSFCLAMVFCIFSRQSIGPIIVTSRFKVVPPR